MNQAELTDAGIAWHLAELVSAEPTTSAQPDLSCEIAGVHLRNPLVLASGILGSSVSLLERCAQAGAGAVTFKSVGPLPRQGHRNPTVVDWGPGLLNAVGLSGPGAPAAVALFAEARSRLRCLDTAFIASIFADTIENFGEVTRTICSAQPALLEVNISCPNVHDELGLPFASSADSSARVTEAVKQAATCPVVVKLAPNVPDIAAIARAVVDAGADAICAINTMPGMVIDVYSGRPILSNRIGGVSGPALKAIAVRAVYEITGAVNVPVIGTGGINSGLDAAEMIMAGATAVGVGSAAYYRGVEAFTEIGDELLAFMRQQGYANLAQMRGIAHG